jgi:hypothetical protein
MIMNDIIVNEAYNLSMDYEWYNSQGESREKGEIGERERERERDKGPSVKS